MSRISRANDSKLHDYLHGMNASSQPLIEEEKGLTPRQRFWSKVLIAGVVLATAYTIYYNYQSNNEFDKDRIRAEKILRKYDALDKQAVDFMEEVEGKKYVDGKVFPEPTFIELRGRVRAGDL